MVASVFDSPVQYLVIHSPLIASTMYGVTWSIAQPCSRLPFRWLASDFVTLIVEVNFELLEFIVPDLLNIVWR